jgi:hypothetical protein
MSYDNLSSVSQNVLKLYQQLTGEERRIPFIFDDFHFCRSRVIGLDITENRIFTLCRIIIWVLFLRMFWNFITSLPVKRRGSLSFLTIFTFAVPELLYPPQQCCRGYTGFTMSVRLSVCRQILCRMITWVVFLRIFWNFISSLPVKRGGSLSFLTIFTIAVPELLDLIWRKIGCLPYVVW